MIVLSKQARVFTVVFSVAVALTLAFVASSAADTAADVAALHAVDQAWVKAYNAGDADTVASLYEENAVLLPPGAPAATGRAAIHAFLAKEIAEAAKAGMVTSLGANPVGGVSGDLGWASGTYAVKDKSGKEIETGKYLSVSHKKGGKWRYVRDTYNSDSAPAPEVAAPAKRN